MKKLFYCALALAAMVGCNKEVDVHTNNPASISFGDAFVEIKTRAAADPSITKATLDAFDVWAFMDNTAAVVLKNERVTFDGTEWTYKNLQYWLPEHQYFFGAVAPVDHDNIVVNTTDANEYGLGTITFTNLDGTDDLIYASKAMETGVDVVNNDPGKVNLQFAHLLSKIKFTFINGFTNANSKITVKNVQMSAPKKAVIDLAQDAWWSGYKWQIVESGAVLNFGDVNDGKQLVIGDSKECATHLFTIPNDGALSSYTITFDVDVFQGDFAEAAYTQHMEVKLANQPLQMGKMYNFTATINADSLGLLPIEFGVVEVNGWETGDAQKF